jgi:serralysin
MDRYVFTNEYSQYIGEGGGHSTEITDTDGGIDTVNASAVTSAMTIRLVNGQMSSIDNVDVELNNIENAIGGDGNDKLFGGDAANELFGMRGNDTIRGAKGTDTVTGGEGRDTMSGGGARDVFDFNSLADSGASRQTADRIIDFQPGIDKIDLSGIDASTILANNNTFVWRGTAAFTTSADGEVRYQQFDVAGTTGDHTMVWCDVDNDTGAEFAIRVTNLIAFSSTDFFL